MKKKFLMVCLALMFCLAFSLPCFAADKTITVTVSMEKFTVGQGYRIEPILVEVPEKTRASKVITNLLGEGNYSNTGTVNSSFYLSRVKDSGSNSIQVPEYLIRAMAKGNAAITERSVSGELGEFDYTSDSGWMISINNSFINTSSADYELQNGDALRWQFSLYGYGADLGSNNGNWSEEDSLVVTANKDALTAKMAEANQGSDTAVADSNAYKSALHVLENIEATQAQTDTALKDLSNYLESKSDTAAVTPNTLKTVTLAPNQYIFQYAPDYTAVTEVFLNQRIMALKVDEQKTLSASVMPEAATMKNVTWHSSDDAVAKVSEKGVITARKEGNAEITATTLDGNKRAVCTVTVEKKNNPIALMKDVQVGAWYYDDVAYVMEKGIMVGTGTTTFGTDIPMTRSMFVAVLGRHAKIADSNAAAPGKTDFDDVDSSSYYASHVAWASQNGIVFGTGGGKFSPNDEISREDITVIMMRYAKLVDISLPESSSLTPFADDSQIANYARNAVYCLKEAGIVKGVGGNCFQPKGNTSRAAAARVLHLLLEA